jgi:hypothetical protein
MRVYPAFIFGEACTCRRLSARVRPKAHDSILVNDDDVMIACANFQIILPPTARQPMSRRQNPPGQFILSTAE